MEKECPFCGDAVSESDFHDIEADMQFENWTCVSCGMLFWEKQEALDAG